MKVKSKITLVFFDIGVETRIVGAHWANAVKLSAGGVFNWFIANKPHKAYEIIVFDCNSEGHEAIVACFNAGYFKVAMLKNVSNKIVLFDFDGVIVDTFEMCLKLGQRQYPDLNAETYRDFSNGNVQELIAERERVSPRVDMFDYFAAYTPLMMEREPVKGIAQILHTLASKYPLIIVSATIESPIGDYLSKYDLSKYFAEILGRNNGQSKTVKIQDVVTRYGVQAQNVVFITDTLGDLKEANKVGVKTIGVTWGFHQKERLARGNPNAIIEDPSLLLGAVEAQLA